MKQPRRTSKLWKYLNESGALERGKDAIVAAKKDFRKEYLKQYKADYKNTHKQYNIVLTQKERSIILLAAKERELKPSSFIKAAALAFCKQSFIVSHPSTLYAILQKLLLYETTIAQIAAKDKEAWYKPDRKYGELERIVQNIRSDIETAYCKPLTLEKAIQEQLMREPEFYTTLQTILKDHDSHKLRT